MKRLNDYKLQELQDLVLLYRKREVPFNLEICFRYYEDRPVVKITSPVSCSYNGLSPNIDELFDIDKILLLLNEKERREISEQYDAIMASTEKTDKIIKGLLPQGNETDIVTVEE